MKWKLDPFDTSVFDEPCFKSFLAKPLPATLKLKKGFYTGFALPVSSVIRSLENNQFRFISIRNTYKHSQLPPTPKIPTEISIKPFTGMQISDHDLKAFVTPIWEYSRYKIDKEIPLAKSLALYQLWGENSLYRGYADYCFAALHGKKVIGICTIKMKNKDGYIDLLGISKQWQGMHIGSALMHSALRYTRAKDMKQTFVVTEGENIRANAFYQTNGFRLHKVDLVYHKHVR